MNDIAASHCALLRLKRAYQDNHEFREHRATPQMVSAAVLQRSPINHQT